MLPNAPLNKVRLAIQKAVTNAALNILPLAGYYGAYAVILFRTARGELSLGDLTFLSGAFLRSRNALENVFSTLSNVSEQALFVRDLFCRGCTAPACRYPGAKSRLSG